MKLLMIHNILLLTLLTFVHAQNFGDSTNVAKDVFPLRIGRTWEYSYYRFSDQDPLSFPSGNQDIGSVSYSILDSSSHADTVRWTIKLIRHLSHSNWGITDTSYKTEDTTQYILYEVLTGNHQLIADSWFLWVFPRYNTQVFRYQLTDSEGYAIMSYILPSGFGPAYTFKYCSDTGLTHVSYFSSGITFSDYLDASLTNNTLTEISTPPNTDTRIATLLLFQNYPNPFNPSTSISFSLPSESFVTLKVFDILGREVAVLVSEKLPAGNHTQQWHAKNLPSGVYIYRLQAGTFTQTRKLVLLK